MTTDETPQPIKPDTAGMDVPDDLDTAYEKMARMRFIEVARQAAERFKKDLETMPTEPTTEMYDTSEDSDGNVGMVRRWNAYRYQVNGRDVIAAGTTLNIIDPNLDTYMVLREGHFIYTEEDIENQAERLRKELTERFPDAPESFAENYVNEYKDFVGCLMTIVVVEIWKGDDMIERFSHDDARGAGQWRNHLMDMNMTYRFWKSIINHQQIDLGGTS